MTGVQSRSAQKAGKADELNPWELPTMLWKTWALLPRHAKQESGNTRNKNFYSSQFPHLSKLGIWIECHAKPENGNTRWDFQGIPSEITFSFDVQSLKALQCILCTISWQKNRQTIYFMIIQGVPKKSVICGKLSLRATGLS